jgi:predicted enzyme related to lactoylglutathione lyase
MAERTQYTPGTFCWAELTTTDQDAAKAFYGELFGWEANDVPVGDGAVYSMMRHDGKDTAAISFQPRQQRDAGAPPMWNSYVSVESADAVAQRAAELGATVHAPPFDVMDAGRMAVIQDPQGAFFELWEPRDHFGARSVNAPSAFTWNELASRDPDASAAFYSDLFGWTIAPFEGSSFRYLIIANGDQANGGMRDLPPGTSPQWLVYFGADDVEAALAKIEELGGAKLAGPIAFGPGAIGVARDPQGAMFALWAGEFGP